MNWKTAVTEKLNIEFPMIQAPMFGVTTPAMVSAAAKAKCLPYPYQNKLTSELRKAARSIENAELVNIWVGQGKYPFTELSTQEILKELIAETSSLSIQRTP